MRVFFPSLEGSVFDAPILEGCGRYPVILFTHGNCVGDVNHYLRWFQLPAQLARSGYVVVVPQLAAGSEHPSVDQSTQQVLVDVLQWIRQDWEHRATLLPAPATGLAGNSYGALHAGILATKTEVAAVASLSGVWGEEWPDPASGPREVLRGAVPRLFTWGTEQFSERDAVLGDSIWNQIARPKHRAVFTDGQHHDYLYRPNLPCRDTRGPCRYVGEATADLVTMFFAKYLPPELWPNLPDRIPSSLVPPPLQLTPEQEFYAGGHLIGMKLLDGDSDCKVTITRELPTYRTVPYVKYVPQLAADKDVLDRDLIPKFTEPASTSPAVRWVASQSPPPGARVAAGTEVRMQLRVGPIP
jgi:dienelactone hydrolase